MEKREIRFIKIVSKGRTDKRLAESAFWKSSFLEGVKSWKEIIKECVSRDRI